VRLLATTGMRLGEALALRWSDVDLAGRALRLRDAKAGARTVHLGATAVAILDAVELKSGYVAHGADADRPLSHTTMEKAWRQLRKRTEIDGGRPHNLRHSVGTFAALSGANAFAVRDLLGHKTLAMTGRYVERAADTVRAATDAVSNRVAAALNAGTTMPAEVIKITDRR